MRRKNHFIYFFTTLIMLVAGVTGCKKFLDVNKNLNDPTAVPVALLLSKCERDISQNTALGTGLGSTMSIYVHQTTGRVGADRYGAGSAGWDGLYGAITNLNVVINQGTAETRYAYAGIAKILKAYTYSILVDVYGDVPFSEFDKFTDGITQPKFDKGKDIYPQLLAMIDEGIADINNPAPNASKPGADDYIYKGDLTKWKKAANTIKLKLYTQVRRVQDVKAAVTALLATPANLINSQAESFMMPYGPFGTTDDRHPAYTGDYNATQRGGQLFSPWMYEIMKGKNPNILNGITDSRIPYYVYNQKSAVGGSNPTPENCTEYRDGGFISIYFGSNGNCRDGSNSNTYSLLGLYPAGGRYEDKAAVAINTITALKAGTGALPHQFITYADRLYLEAELINTGVITGDEKAVFTAALNESFKQMDYIIINYIKPGSAGSPQTVPLVDTLAATTAYKTAVLAAFDAGTAAKKLELIMTEKWINRIENPVDSYTDYRRTGYPVLFSPAPAGTVTSVTGPDGKVTPVQNDRQYPLSLPFNTNEIALNSNAPPQKIPENYKVFWQP
ncbi:MAG TPA: SusD/RagB family nutrient-binding outer membrane lipoprotein [Chitinophagaceae bacterium]|nr:SusD/RagB family nutrient-binding outer membrane lipoprotein [Chitinophagaceae bacterium]